MVHLAPRTVWQSNPLSLSALLSLLRSEQPVGLDEGNCHPELVEGSLLCVQGRPDSSTGSE